MVTPGLLRDQPVLSRPSQVLSTAVDLLVAAAVIFIFDKSSAEALE
jgi:hypothetical protein